MRHFYTLTMLFFAFLLVSCEKDDPELLDCTTYHWQYEGESTPSEWGICFVDCGGPVQSPIDIKGAVVDGSLTALETHYADAPIELLNNGHTVVFEYQAGSTLKLEGEDYTLVQFHFHTKSEHTLDGVYYPMEVHLVHQNAAGHLAVLGVLFEEGDENEFLAKFNDHLPTKAEERYSSTDLVNVEDVLPTTRGYYIYDGSLTTPPCSEIATWMVLKTPVEASTAQIEKMHCIVHNNNRPIQPLNGRTIKEFN